MTPLTLGDIESALGIVYASMPPTPQYAWPSLREALGTEVWVKHENHTPTGAFKVRGGLTYVDWLQRAHPDVTRIVSATRGNHGQSLARAGRAAGLDVLIYVPHGNAAEKNAAMRAFGAELIEHGADYDEARPLAERAGREAGAHYVPGFHRELVRGVATYAYELLEAVPDLDTIYVPVGGGSGACGTIMARDALDAKTEVVGVVSDAAPVTRLSAEAGEALSLTDSPATFADGLAVRAAYAEAVPVYARGLARFVSVSDDEVADAVRLYHTATHNMAEGAGAAPLAAAMKERAINEGRKVAVVHCGGNIDAAWYAMVLQGGTPRPS